MVSIKLLLITNYLHCLCCFFISTLFALVYITMYILNIASAVQKISFYEVGNFIFKNYYERITFSKENSFYSMKCLKKRFVVAGKQINRKIHDPRNFKPHCQSFIRKRKDQISKTIRNKYLSVKHFWKHKHCWYKISY